MDFIVASAAKYSYALQEHADACHLPLAVVRLRLRPRLRVRHGNSKTTISRAGCKFCSKTRRTTGWRGKCREREKEREAGRREKREERRGMNVVGWLVIDAGDKEAVARVKFRAGSGPVSSSSSASASACHRCSRSECNKMLPIVFGRSVVFYCFCFFCCCSLFSLLFRLLCVCVVFFSLPIANFVASQSPQSRLRIEAQHQLRALHGSCTYGWDSL